MTQLQFIEFEPALARRTDPETSHQAAAEITQKAKGLRALFLFELQQYCSDNRVKSATANEVAQGRESLRKRAKECVNLGLIQTCDARICSVTGKNATTYQVK